MSQVRSAPRSYYKEINEYTWNLSFPPKILDPDTLLRQVLFSSNWSVGRQLLRHQQFNIQCCGSGSANFGLIGTGTDPWPDPTFFCKQICTRHAIYTKKRPFLYCLYFLRKACKSCCGFFMMLTWSFFLFTWPCFGSDPGQVMDP